MLGTIRHASAGLEDPPQEWLAVSVMLPGAGEGQNWAGQRWTEGMGVGQNTMSPPEPWRYYLAGADLRKPIAAVFYPG